jgi:unsaturated rhamnogalacturonyl hydrolase
MNDLLKTYIYQLINKFHPYNDTKRMTYEDGLMLIAAEKYYKLTSDEFVFNFLEKYLDYHINDNGEIVNYHLDEYNIDNILAGNVLFFVYEKTGKKKYLKTIELLRKQLLTHPRTESMNFWHKKRYPYQVWLDGLYMGQVFYLRYALLKKDFSIIDDVYRQVMNTDKYLWDQKRKLYVHAYDEKKVMQWADEETGHSPNIWSRSVGWFAMALVDLIELLPNDFTSEKTAFSELIVKLIDGVKPHLDPEYSMMYQVVDKPNVKGNYLETSGTAMLAYAALKGYRLGVLDSSYQLLGEKIVKGINEKYLRDENGKIILGGICAVAGLDNERRDGSVAYYLSEKIAENEIKGVGPYLFALMELAE